MASSSSPSFGFITHNAALGVGPERDYSGFVLASGTGASIARMLRAAGHRAVSADEAGQPPARDNGPLSSATVLGIPYVREQLNRYGCRALVPFKASSRLEALASGLGIELLAPPARLVRQLENKLQLPAIADAAGVAIPATRIVRLDDALVAAARAGELDLPRLFQPAMAFAGAGTRTMHEADDVARLVAGAVRGSVGKLVEPVEGEPTCVNGVVVDDSTVLVAGVCRQLTGIPGCTASEFGSCGNEWSLPLPSPRAQQVRDAAHRVGVALAARGFRGMFGVDAMVRADGSCVLIEINPRCTASLSLQLQLQQADGGPTLLDAHLAAFVFAPLATAARDRFHRDAPPPEHPPAASLIVYNQLDEPLDPPAGLEPGVWVVDAATGELVRQRDGYRFDHLTAPHELLLFAQQPGRPVQPGAELVRLIFSRQVAAGPDASTLLPDVARLADQMTTARLPRWATGP